MMRHAKVSALRTFVAESNAIEGIRRPPTRDEVEAHELILGLDELEVTPLEAFVDVCTEGRGLLRVGKGMNVRVGSHIPPLGGPLIPTELGLLLDEINSGHLTVWEAHVRYETLHPFMDGNGRSGRVIWAWTMERQGWDPFALPFLHRAYYQALDHQRDPGFERTREELEEGE